MDEKVGDSIHDRTENRSRVPAANRYAVLAAVLCAAAIYLRSMDSLPSRMDDAARIPIVLVAIALVGITALLASGFSANAQDSTPVGAWRRAWRYSWLLPRRIRNGTQATRTSSRTLQHTRS
jgi:hypothetical protein